MTASPISSAAAFYLAALTGAYGGTLVQGLWSLAGAGGLPGQWRDLIIAPAVVLGIGSLALPFVMLGLAAFGLPLAASLRRHAVRPWVGGVALAWGAVAGKLFLAAVEYAMTARGFHPLRLRSPDLGLCYGIPTGLAWWWLQRARARHGAAGRAP